MHETATHRVRPAGCGCGTSAALPDAPVYVVGSLGFDFGTEARRDAIYAANGGSPIVTAGALAAFLSVPDNAAEAASIIWTINNDQHTIYAIRPHDAYGADAYAQLTAVLNKGIDRVSVPGWVRGNTRLLNGCVVPAVEPDMQGFRLWSTASLASGDGAPAPGHGDDGSGPTRDDLQNFMNRIYFELRNRGATPQDRASNFAATQAYLVTKAVSYAMGRGLNLQDVAVTHSPLCRPGSECWDVTLNFFDPGNVSNEARKTFRFTIDVSDVRPVMIGPMFKFNSY